MLTYADASTRCRLTLTYAACSDGENLTRAARAWVFGQDLEIMASFLAQASLGEVQNFAHAGLSECVRVCVWLCVYRF